MDEQAVAEAVDAAFAECGGTPGAVVGVRDGDITWTRAVGLADPAAGTPMDPAMHLRIGSITKTFTATLLLQLVERGTVDLDDPVARWIDGVPEGERTTLRHLAVMRSGIASYTADPALLGRILADPGAPIPTEDLLASAFALPRAFEPGEGFAYSNTNYVLLGEVVARAGGAPFDVQLRERILEPLGLDDTWWPGTSSALPEPFARGWTLSVPGTPVDAPVDTTDWNPAWGGAAGALVSTVDDLLTWAGALASGEGLLDPDTQALRLDSFGPAPDFGPGVDYGIGLLGIGRWVGHSGDIPGYRSSAYHHLDARVSVAVLTASDILAGACPVEYAGRFVPGEAPCIAPNSRLFGAVGEALGLPTDLPHV